MCPPRTPTQVDKVFPAHSNTDDLAVVAAYLEAMHPDSVRLILGFSQGGWGVWLWALWHERRPGRGAAPSCHAP